MTAQITREYMTPYKVSELSFTFSDIEGKKILENWMKVCRDTIAEGIMQEEGRKGAIEKALKEPIETVETIKHSVSWHCKESVFLTEEHKKTWGIKRRYSEWINGVDFARFAVTVKFAEAVNGIDAVTKKPNSVFKEATGIEETRKGAIAAVYQEQASLTSGVRATIKQGAHTEGLGVLSTYRSGIKQRFVSELNAAEGYSKGWRIIGKYEESTALSDSAKSGIKVYKTDEIGIVDKRLKSVASGVLSNVVISEGETSYAVFEQSADQVAGYAPFVEFKVGDYEYEKALFRMTFSRARLNNDMKFYDYAVHVDIPDTVDRGECAVNGETKIYFNKHYYHAPEVNVTTIGGTSILIPRIISLDDEDETGRYFVVILENLNGESKAGRISWSARGY